MSVSRSLRAWVDFTNDLIGDRARPFPMVEVLRRLSDTFDATAGWDGPSADETFVAVVFRPPPKWPAPGMPELWREHRFEHPLQRWYAMSKSEAPMTLERVPDQVVDARGRAFARDLLGEGMEHQLSVPLGTSTAQPGTFVLNRGDADFTASQVHLAVQLQPLLMLLEHQGRSRPVTSEFGKRFGLTRRETAVLALLDEGLTAGAIARRLGCSPRTVSKHLEHIYRKLGVRDRVQAIRLTDRYQFDEHATSSTSTTSAALDPAPPYGWSPVTGERDLVVLASQPSIAAR